MRSDPPSVVCAAGALAAALVLGCPASEARPKSGRADSGRETTDSARGSRDRYRYRDEWRRFGWWDAAGTAALTGAYYAVEFGLDGPHDIHWDRPILLDAPVRDLLVLPTRRGRERADRASDYF